jgi:DNA (cytosine-5)-methyltransferase 1
MTVDDPTDDGPGDGEEMSGLPCIDLFSGAGGLSLGLRDAGFQVIAAVEIDRDAVQTYASHHPTVNQHDVHIAKVSFRHLRGQIALVAGGPPCQPFSSGGKRLSTADDRNAVPDYIKVLKDVEPPAFLLENVPGLAVGARGLYLASVKAEIEAIQQLGYKVTYKVINAADYGVPQKRRRLIMVGLRGHREFSFPLPTHGSGRPLPYVSAGSKVDPREPVGEPNPSVVTYAKRPDLRPNPYDGHVYNGGGRPIDLLRASHTILASAGGNKTHWLDAQAIAIEYHQHLMSGGLPRTGVVPGARRLTVEESALLQTFPSEVRFHGTRSSRYTQVGNAVPCLLAQILADAIREQLPD